MGVKLFSPLLHHALPFPVAQHVITSMFFFIVFPTFHRVSASTISQVESSFSLSVMVFTSCSKVTDSELSSPNKLSSLERSGRLESNTYWMIWSPNPFFWSCFTICPSVCWLKKDTNTNLAL